MEQHIVIILIDDAVFEQFSTFGGGVPSLTIDKDASEGLPYNRFHTTALCSPTHVALIKGRNHHSTVFAGITELATGYEGYIYIVSKSCTIVLNLLVKS
ncbi:sulfatase-like hydrolase/transferase [Flavobacterium saccharophilum]|uniref:sulfatase-like hydrolase/transferase n=1 Tax=Flavobacterium saccharophilum TaxID=29534 RepID=UPI000A3294A1